MDFSDLDDGLLQEADPSNLRPEGEAADEEMEGWRVAQRGKLRKVAELANKVAASQKAKTSSPSG
jgi:hypothetical protein